MPAHWATATSEKNFNTSLPLNVLTRLFDRIALHIPVSAVVCLSQTHPMLMGKLSAHLCQSFDELLASRVSRTNVDSFRTLLLRTRAVISGSTVLHFILRDNHWRPADFDLYTPFGTGYAIVHWLVNNEGYKVVSDGSRSFIFHPHTVTAPPGPCDWTTDLVATASVHRNTRQTNKYDSTNSDIYRVYKLCSTKNTFVDVIESIKPSFLPPITRFHSTIVMNYLSPTSLVVLYPDLTFKREGILQYRDTNTLESYDDPNEAQQPEDTTDTSGRRQDYVKKYKLRGFTLSSRPADLLRPCGAACPSLRRAVSDEVDRWALRIPLTRDQSGPIVLASAVDEDSTAERGANTDTDPSLSPSPGTAGALLIEVQSAAPGPVASVSPSAPSSSWASSCVTDLSEGFSSISISSGGLSWVGHEPIPNHSEHRSCSRPPLPGTQWILKAPPQPDDGTQRRRRRRDVCRNPHCYYQGHSPPSLSL
ncbi:hypothetical protein DXG01_004875 [Tephrocybe rancida]|nr:hypothetical protein DXG01_004875 [Tephrocybe rancida]